MAGKKETLPIYKQIEKFIQESIKVGRYQQGMMIPSEEDFCAMFNTSRMTVRKAIDEMVMRSEVYRIKGRGTFVSRFNIEKTMNVAAGWKETMTAAGYVTSSQVLKFDVEEADDEVACSLNIPLGSDVYVLERLRCADGVPVLIEKAHLNCALFPNFLGFSFQEQSLYKVMEENFNISLEHVYQKVSTEIVTDYYAQKLFNANSAVALIMNNTSYDELSRPIEHTICIINGERYTLRYMVKRR